MEVEAIYCYPVKSLRGISLPSAQLSRIGFPYDRRYMLARVHEHVEQNPRKNGTLYEPMHISAFPKMCLFRPSFVESGNEILITYRDPSTGDISTLTLPLEPDNVGALEEVPVNMHQSQTMGFKMPESEWFSKIFGFEVLLLHLGEHRRTVLGNYAPNAAARNAQRQPKTSTYSWLSSMAASVMGGDSVSDEDYQIGFADCAPYLVVSSKSLEDVSARLPEGISMDMTKFRPNIVISGAESLYEEDYWRELSFCSQKNQQKASLNLTANCVRCVSLNVDYETGAPGKGPEGQILKSLMKDRRHDMGHKYSPIFGRYAFLSRDSPAAERDKGDFLLSVGDQVDIVKINEERQTSKWPGMGTTPKTEIWAI